MCRRAAIVLLTVVVPGCSLMPPKSEHVRAREMEGAVLSMAATALETGQVETARRLFGRLLEIDPESLPARMGLGDVALRERETEAAAGWYLTAIACAEHVGELQAALLAHGRAALAAGQLEAAKNSFARLTDPNENMSRASAAWGHNGLGLALLLEGELPGAVAAMEQAVMIAPGEKRFQANLSRALAMRRAAAPGDRLRGAGADRDGSSAVGREVADSMQATTASPEPVAENPSAPNADSQLPPVESAQDAGEDEGIEVSQKGPRVPGATGRILPRASGPSGGSPASGGVPMMVVTENGAPFLQFGAFAELSNAEAVAEAVGEVTAEPVNISDVENEPGVPLYRVRIGPLSSGGALALVAEMESHGYRVANPGRAFDQDQDPVSRLLRRLTVQLVGGDGGQYLQVGAYRDRAAAESLAEQLRDATDRPVRVSQVEHDDGPLHRVRIGPLVPDDRLIEMFGAGN